MPLGLGAEVKDEQTRRFQLAAWLIEGHRQLGAQRARSALLLVLGNVLLAVWVVLLSFLAVAIKPDWRLLLVGTALAFFCVLVSILFALLASAGLQPGGGSAAPVAGLFSQSEAGGQMPGLSQAQFSELFHQATRQQMLEGMLGELYAQVRRRAWQERWIRWALVAFALAFVLFTLATVVLLVLLVS